MPLAGKALDHSSGQQQRLAARSFSIAHALLCQPTRSVCLATESHALPLDTQPRRFDGDAPSVFHASFLWPIENTVDSVVLGVNFIVSWPDIDLAERRKIGSRCLGCYLETFRFDFQKMLSGCGAFWEPLQ